MSIFAIFAACLGPPFFFTTLPFFLLLHLLLLRFLPAHNLATADKTLAIFFLVQIYANAFNPGHKCTNNNGKFSQTEKKQNRRKA